MEDGMRKAKIFIGLWQANFIGTSFGFWAALNEQNHNAIVWALMVTYWLGATHFVWHSIRKIFWPEDVGRF
jgi:hypothetical protein